MVPEIICGARIGGGDDIPPGPPAADMVERGELTGKTIGIGKAGRRSRHQPNAPRRPRQRREQGQRLEPEYTVMRLAGRRRCAFQLHLHEIGEEKQIEPCLLRHAGGSDLMREVVAGPAMSRAPGRDMVPGGKEEQAQPHPPSSGHATPSSR